MYFRVRLTLPLREFLLSHSISFLPVFFSTMKAVEAKAIQIAYRLKVIVSNDVKLLQNNASKASRDGIYKEL